ncbi:MAG: hypothetical protein IKP43_03540 [Bacteroidaceae bacterium]|nr:hypothetical protein [Bacteroidaceae bacterium]
MENEQDKQKDIDLGVVAASSIVGAASGFATGKIADLTSNSQNEGNSTTEQPAELQPTELQPAELQPTELQPANNDTNTEVVVEVTDEDIVNPNDEIEDISTVYGGPPIEEEDVDIDIVTDVYGPPVDDIYVDIVNPNDEIEDISTVYGGPPIDEEDVDIDIVTDVYGPPVDDITPFDDLTDSLLAEPDI